MTKPEVLQVLLQTPGRYLSTVDADWVILDRPQLPRYARALASLVDAANLARAQRPGATPSRFAV